MRKKEKLQEEKTKRKAKLQWRRYKLGTVGIILVALFASLLIYVGVLSILSQSNVGYAFLAFGIVFWLGVGLDIYRMYGY